MATSSVCHAFVRDTYSAALEDEYEKCGASHLLHCKLNFDLAYFSIHVIANLFVA